MAGDDLALGRAQNMGIQKLLQAEQEASEVIAAAKAQKFNRLKQAKIEAEAEIAAYKQQREAQFQVFAKEVRASRARPPRAADAR